MQQSAPTTTEPAWIPAVRAAMRGRGLSRNKLGKRIGVADGLVSRWLTQKGKPNPANCLRLHRVLDVPLEVLCDQEPDEAIAS